MKTSPIALNFILFYIIIWISLCTELAVSFQPNSSQQRSTPTNTCSENIVHNNNNKVRSKILLNVISRREALDQVSKTASVFASTSASVSNTLLYPSIVNAATEDQSTITTSTSVKIPTVKLGGNKSSLEVSRTIQGYWQLAGGHGKYNIDNVIQTMQKHYDVGMTTLDTADIYGPSEQIVGKFVDKVKSSGSDMIPCTKFCCFRYLDEIDKNEVRDRVNKVRM